MSSRGKEHRIKYQISSHYKKSIENIHNLSHNFSTVPSIVQNANWWRMNGTRLELNWTGRLAWKRTKWPQMMSWRGIWGKCEGE
jgi:hypothetical protein